MPSSQSTRTQPSGTNAPPATGALKNSTESVTSLVVPELEPYLTVITVDSATGSLSEEREAPSKSQPFLTVAGMIAAINSVVIGTTCGLFAGIVSSNPAIASPIAGLTGAGTAGVVHLAHQLRVLRRRDGMVVDEFAIAVLSHIVDKEGGHGPHL